MKTYTITEQELISLCKDTGSEEIFEQFISDYGFVIAKDPVTDWSEVKQKYLEHQIYNYDHGYPALFKWLEKSYSGIDIPKIEVKDLVYSPCKLNDVLDDKQIEDQQKRVEYLYRMGFITDRERDFTTRALEFGWKVSIFFSQGSTGTNVKISFEYIDKHSIR